MSQHIVDEESALLHPCDATAHNRNGVKRSKFPTGKVTAAVFLAALFALAVSFAPTNVENTIETNEIDLQASAWSGQVCIWLSVSKF